MSTLVQNANSENVSQDTDDAFLEGLESMSREVEQLSDEATDSPAVEQIDISFVIPLKNEEQTVTKLCASIVENIPAGKTHEIILIDDGSSDSTWNIVEELSEKNPKAVRGLRFRCNVGKAAALSAGFRATKGDIVFTMDGDLQDDPTEIKKFLAKVEEGYDLVSGWKRSRHDPWHKVLPSRIFNWMTSRITGVKLHDHNCGFKCYRGQLARGITLHGELHRMVPAIASQRGYQVTEIEVRHHPRRHGVSKYGLERFLRGFSDMITVGFMQRFGQRPAHFLNAIAFLYFGVSLALLLTGLVMGVSDVAGVCVFFSGVILFAISGIVFSLGLMSELALRGGLPATWHLPISRDTAVEPNNPRTTTLERRVSTRYEG